MKLKIFATTLLLCFSIMANSLAIEATDKKPITKIDEKSVDDIKTFDFEKIFIEADQYFNAAQKWQKIKCKPVSGFVCTKKECPKLKIAEDSHMILDKKNEVISLCKNKICRYYPAEFKQTGVFINAIVKDSQGLVIRVLGDSRYKEISMIGLDAYLTNGNCYNVENEKSEDEKKDIKK